MPVMAAKDAKVRAKITAEKDTTGNPGSDNNTPASPADASKPKPAPRARKLMQTNFSIVPVSGQDSRAKREVMVSGCLGRPVDARLLEG